MWNDIWIIAECGAVPTRTEKLDAHRNMAANIEQMFQDFILNKIKEIEDRNEDVTLGYVTVVFRLTDGLLLAASRRI